MKVLPRVIRTKSTKDYDCEMQNLSLEFKTAPNDPACHIWRRSGSDKTIEMFFASTNWGGSDVRWPTFLWMPVNESTNRCFRNLRLDDITCAGIYSSSFWLLLSFLGWLVKWLLCINLFLLANGNDKGDDSFGKKVHKTRKLSKFS